MSTFSPDVVSAILKHMNGDHTDDNLLIVRAFANPAARSAVMTGFDGSVATWDATVDGATSEVRIAWPAGPITERAEVRREVVALYDAACVKLGIEPRPH
ncbi:DUF2470 domain-containing protein [Agreia sp. Leaf283]|uniref:DUF2470 domain-containing protein n=1 Tax=Agreia sp. Leaf283 TaxID=1736321 RepID=UPI0006F2CFA3|nr:DUF2470 domain-containing protein [Agreia sp. Leaf283]KQP54061.1 hypothetical protein ASF51_18310 [Agreia sp. Leaf283]